eukprot:gene9867-11684_t
MYSKTWGAYCLGWWSISFVLKNYKHPLLKTPKPSESLVGESMLVIHGMFRKGESVDEEFKPFALVVTDQNTLGCSPFAGFVQAMPKNNFPEKKRKKCGNTDEEGAAVDVEQDDDEAENEYDKAAEINNEEAGKEDDAEDDEEDAAGDDTAGTPQRFGKAPKRAITSFVMGDDEEIASPSKTPKTAEENEENEKEKQAARRK